MILVGNSRGGGQDLAAHLLKDDNEHVDVHELRGFSSSDLHGAFKEAQALSKATRASKYLFSLSLNPPGEERVSIESFEAAIAKVEHGLGLEDQPRAIVFHEKEGRRHCHAVWSRVDMEALKVIPMDFHKRKLNGIARELYLENGWTLPRGFQANEPSDPKNYSLAEWQQAKRRGKDPKKLKAVFQDCWAMSDSKISLASALREHGLILARGDRRGIVAVDREGEVYALARWAGVKTKDVRGRIGPTETLPSTDEALAQHRRELKPAFAKWAGEVRDEKALLKTSQANERKKLIAEHRKTRAALKTAQTDRWHAETIARSKRFRSGLSGLWDRLRGEHGKIKRLNEREAEASMRRDRQEREKLIAEQLAARRSLIIDHKRQQESLGLNRTALAEAWQKLQRSSQPRRRVRTLASRRSRDGPEPG